MRAADGREATVAMSQMTRRVASITKAAFKVWLHSVARQQSLGRRGMPGIWIVHAATLTQHGVTDSLPPDVAEVVRESELRRQRRNKSKGNASKPTADGSAAGSCARGRSNGSTAVKNGRSTPQLAALPATGNDELQRLAAAGATEQEVAEAALQMQLNAISAASDETVNAVKAPAAHSTAPAEESVEESEAKLEAGTLKAAIFAVLKEAGPAGLNVNDIMAAVGPLGFTWPGNGRAGKSSISSTCGHCAVFVRLDAGIFALRALPGALDRVNTASAPYSRDVLEVCPAFEPVRTTRMVFQHWHAVH